MTDPSPMDYAGRYQALRKDRCSQHDGIFPPLEGLRSRSTDELLLSVSFSALGATDLYLSQSLDRIRVARVTFKWVIIPTTISRLFTLEGFHNNFGEYLEELTIDGEAFWILREPHFSAVRKKILGMELSNEFKQQYQHAYFEDPK